MGCICTTGKIKIRMKYTLRRSIIDMSKLIIFGVWNQHTHFIEDVEGKREMMKHFKAEVLLQEVMKFYDITDDMVHEIDVTEYIDYKFSTINYIKEELIKEEMERKDREIEIYDRDKKMMDLAYQDDADAPDDRIMFQLFAPSGEIETYKNIEIGGKTYTTDDKGIVIVDNIKESDSNE